MQELLDRVPGKRARLLIVVTLCLVPTAHVAVQFDRDHGFTRALRFSAASLECALPQVRELSPPIRVGHGSDGKYYAEVAVDPTLRDPNLARALDISEYRARRILLPFLAWVIGFGHPKAVLNIYALLNLFFWYLLLALLLRALRPATLRDWICLSAIVWTSGVLISVARSFTDLPGATLVVAASLVVPQLQSSVMSLAILTKETYAMCSWIPLLELRKLGASWWQLAGHSAMMFMPVAVWMLYVHARFQTSPYPGGNFSWPMAGWFHALSGHCPHQPALNAIAAASLFLQLIYLVVRPKPDSFFWRAGISFAIASIFLGPDPFVNQGSFTRDMILIPTAFNALLMRDRKSFWRWFVPGNVGLVGGFVEFFGEIMSRWG